MQILTPSPAAIIQALRILKEGGTVAHATETCYGLACDLTNQEAVEKLFKIKNRPIDQPVSALFPSIKTTEEWVEWNEEARKFAEEHLPGPFTIILPIKQEKWNCIFPTPQPSTINHQPSTLGIRISPHPIATELAQRFGKPLSTTSANVHGKPNPYSTEEIQNQFDGADFKADLVLDSGQLEKKEPSKVVSFCEGTINIVRE